MSIDAKLVVLSKNATKGEVKLKLPLTVGRDKKAGICIAHPMVSRIHCTLYEDSGHLAVSDNGSANGTYVDDQKVQRSVIAPGSRIRIGPLEFVAVYNVQSVKQQNRGPIQEASTGYRDPLRDSRLEDFMNDAVGEDDPEAVDYDDHHDSVLLEGISTGTDATALVTDQFPLAGGEAPAADQFAQGGDVNFNNFFQQFSELEDDSVMRDSQTDK